MERSKAAQDAGHQVVPQVAGRPFGILIYLSTKHCFKDMPSFAPLRNTLFAKQPEAMGDADLKARLIRESKASMHILRETQPMVAQVVNGFDRQPLPGEPVGYEPTRIERSLHLPPSTASNPSTSSTSNSLNATAQRS